MGLRAAVTLALLSLGTAAVPLAAMAQLQEQGAVACRRSDQQPHPLRDADGAAAFYFGLPLAQLDPEQRAFLGTLFQDGGGCSLSAGAARLAGKDGLLLTLAYGDGSSTQAFCQNSRLQACLVRARTNANPSPAWGPGNLLVRPRPATTLAGGTNAAALVEVEILTAKRQSLGSFTAPQALVPLQPEGL